MYRPATWRMGFMPDALGPIDHKDSPAPKPSLSAIAVFSNLVASSHKLKNGSRPTSCIARRVSPEPRSTGLHTLPTEIIQMIFQFVFESCVGQEDGDPALWLDEDPLAPSLFPYSPACVSLRWFQILTAIPVYWTRMVITLDAVAVSLNAACTVLQWARNRPLKVIVTRHHGTFETLDSERAGVGRVMAFLRPHIGRIWSLSFDVEHSSSIPSLWRESGRAPRLKALTLMSHSDSGPISQSSKWLSAGSFREYEGKLRVPLLEEVTFSGHFLKNPLIAHPRLASWFKHITSLNICGDAASDGDVISLYKFLSVLDVFPSIRELTVKDIRFDDNAPYPNLLVLRPTVLCLYRITGRTALRGILTRVRMETSLREDITIIDCTVHGFREPDVDSNLGFSSTNLTLASMNPGATIEDLVSRWNGERLSVISCPRLSRTFLERLHGETAPMSLSHLRVVDCDNFNAGDLISLVQSRANQAAFVSLMGVPDDDSFRALVELSVQGRGPPISAKRATWLAEHVDTFSWNTVARDGLRYVWDESRGKLVIMSATDSL